MTCWAFCFGGFSARNQHPDKTFAHRLRLTHFFSSRRVFGFLIGTVLAGSGLYYYVVDEYKISNRLLVEDIYVSTDPPGPMR
jgi:hypothetical protein